MRRILLILFLSLIAIQFCFAEKKTGEILYIGTYSQRSSEGIYAFQFDREKVELDLIQTKSIKDSPTFLTIHPDGNYLYAVYRDNTIVSFKIDPLGKLSKRNEYDSKGVAPCHVSVDPKGEYAYVSNYIDGVISVFPLGEDGGLNESSDVIMHEGSGPNKDRQKGPHMHSIIPGKDGDYLYASDLGIDKIFTYGIDRSADTLTMIDRQKVQPGSGPRHFDIHPNGDFAYSIEELSSTISAYSANANGSLKHIQRKNLIPEDFSKKNKSADIGISPDGKFLYASNRGHNSLAIFSINQQTGKLSLVDYVDTRGETPRNLYIDQKGEFVFVANRESDSIIIFSRDEDTGRLKFTGKKHTVPEAVCVQQVKNNPIN